MENLVAPHNPIVAKGNKIHKKKGRAVADPANACYITYSVADHTEVEP